MMQEQKKILFISPQGHIIESGISNYQENLINSLKGNYKIDLVYRFGSDYNLSKVKNFKKQIKLLFFIKVFKLIIFKKYDFIFILHFNHIYFSGIKLIYKKLRFFLVAHGIEIWKNYSKRDFKDILINNCIDKIISVSEFTKKRVNKERVYKNKTDNIVINPCINLDKKINYKEKNKFDFIENKYQKYIFFIGRLDSNEKYKGIDEIIECEAKLKRSVNIIVAGSGNDLNRLKKKYNSIIKSKLKMSFIGRVTEDEKFYLINKSSAIILCGYGEGFGIVLLEALLFKKNIITSSLDATMEISKKLNFGTVVDPRNKEKLSKALENSLLTKDDSRFPNESFIKNYGFENFKEKVLENIKI